MKQPPIRQPLIVGLGRSGAGLHLRALRTALDRSPDAWRGPVVAVDPRPGERAPVPDGVTVTPSLEEARALLPPGRAVVHVCTPPAARLAVLTELCEAGYRDLIVEKPLVAGAGELAAVAELRARHGLRLAVVAHWPASALAGRLRDLIDPAGSTGPGGSTDPGRPARPGGLGRLLRVDVTQHKPRFTRSLRTDDGHPTAFDVELPHSLGLVLSLAGPAETTRARLTDLRIGETVRPGLGSALLELRHANGVRSRLFSDLTAPVRERRALFAFERGTAVAHFAPSDADDHVQLVVDGEREVFRDDALTAFLRRAYARFADVPAEDPSWAEDFALHADVVRLLDEAKRRCAETVPGARREEAPRVAAP
ncbi:Gfo/Idh/MocA family oxidoreductase [Streptomyces sp. NPDC090109]|uniref:Gfo/Idh/MocA family oxidoreductase n=1 Tax=unclassified Streptomyces TaxID=2593676 RepID=UPI001969C120|nr:Gfo/Idh/MocA family oxidoreductase [Streptomyces sp. S1]